MRSAHNVGSIFRSADGAGIERIFLTGYSPSPSLPNAVYMSRAHKDIHKTALGAEKSIPWKHARGIRQIIANLRSKGVRIVALEQHKRSTSLFSYTPINGALALVVGNEVRGIDHRILALCDDIVEIPMHGKKNSLNVATAFGLAAYTLRQRLEL